MSLMLLEERVWAEVFRETTRIIRNKLREPEDWPRVKIDVAETLARILAKLFKSLRLVALTDLTGGECTEDPRGGLDLDLLVITDSEAEAYALMHLEKVIDNALKEALIHGTYSSRMLKRIIEYYGKGMLHNIVEIHVNDFYTRALSSSSSCPPIILYKRE